MSRDFGFEPSTRQQVGMLRSNELVIDRHDSHAHLSGESLEIALFLIDAEGRDFLVEQVDCGQIVGRSRCVETSEEDTIVFGYRYGRPGPTRFVLDREPEIPTAKATIVLKRDERLPGIMILISAWAGDESQPEPWDENLADQIALADSKAFWSNHALTLDTAEIQSEIDLARPHGTADEMQEQISMFFSEHA